MTTVSVPHHALLWRAWLCILDYLPIDTRAAVTCSQNCLCSRLNSLGPTASSHRGNAPAHHLFYALQLCNVFLVLRSPKWNAILQMWRSKHREEGIIPSFIFCLWLCSHHQGCCRSSLLPGHTSGWYSGSLPASAPSFFLTELLPLQAFPSLYHSEVFFFPICSCWISWGLCWPIPPACRGP